MDRGAYVRNPATIERHFNAARATVADLRARQVRLRCAIARLDPASLEWRHVNADLLSVRGALDRALGALTARRLELERAEAGR